MALRFPRHQVGSALDEVATALTGSDDQDPHARCQLRPGAAPKLRYATAPCQARTRGRCSLLRGLITVIVGLLRPRRLHRNVGWCSFVERVGVDRRRRISVPPRLCPAACLIRSRVGPRAVPYAFGPTRSTCGGRKGEVGAGTACPSRLGTNEALLARYRCLSYRARGRRRARCPRPGRRPSDARAG